MGLAAKLDDLGKPAWIGLMILGFMAFWPIGLMILAFLIGSGRMGCWRHGGRGRWQQEFKDRMRDAGDRWERWTGRYGQSSGNHAFDEYRAETLRRLEDEQREFMEFLDRLRQAKDKSEFDQFMSERGRRSQGPDAQPQAG